MEDKKYTPWPNYTPHSAEATLQDHTQHHAPVAPTGPNTSAGPPDRHRPSDQHKRIAENLHRLRQLKKTTAALFLRLENDASADLTKLEHLATAYDVAAVALTLGAEIALLMPAVLKETSKTVLKSKRVAEIATKIITEVTDALARRPANRAADYLLPGNKFQHHLGTALHLWANFGPSYLASLRLQTKGKTLQEIARSSDRILNSRPEDLLADSRSELQMQRMQTLHRIDQEIRKEEARYRKL